ncbi:hypothetical protein TSAR_002855 [Trichomalopsis sarcophagae]|uniref:Uncharacterized protein n=1 Tax=Trichomalopsis sarcophagae TaxID=543379 RepID=A0A232FNF8_9HYME|nr:hypothetical protein TSAR_002855 [Trichomalopsis sarcophagae]
MEFSKGEKEEEAREINDVERCRQKVALFLHRYIDVPKIDPRRRDAAATGSALLCISE